VWVEDASVKHTEVESVMIERVVMPAVKRAFAGISLEVVYKVAIRYGFLPFARLSLSAWHL